MTDGFMRSQRRASCQGELFESGEVLEPVMGRAFGERTGKGNQVPARGAPVIDHDAIISVLQARMPSYMMPRRVIAMQSMPLNASGKVDRHALRQLLEGEPA